MTDPGGAPLGAPPRVRPGLRGAGPAGSTRPL